MAEWEYLQQEVRAYVGRLGGAYSDFARELVHEINRVKHHPECAGLIYTVYSRSDKQSGRELKEEWKIAKKLHNWRKERAETRISDIHDIIGITIVVNFPSDRQAVAKYLQRKGVLSIINVESTDIKEENGYHAIHLRVVGATLDREMLRAEIQIKTMLHDGWGAKTHDLTYKPAGAIDQFLLQHMAILGDVLRQLDNQSEIIKDAIVRKWSDDRKYRDVARDSLFRSLITSPQDRRDPEIEAIAREIEANRAELSAVTLRDPLIDDIHKRISTLRSRIGWGRDLCQLSTFLASLRVNGDLNNFALNAVDGWLASCPTPKEKFAAMNFRNLSFYALGLFENSVQSAREAKAIVDNNNIEEAKLISVQNLAYFISEFVVNMEKPDDSLIQEAKELSSQALELSGSPPLPTALDTRGSILIALGSTEREVREGLRMCQDAFEAAPPDKKPVAEAYFRLHERRAFRKLLEWD